jgi:hypothetical protein
VRVIGVLCIVRRARVDSLLSASRVNGFIMVDIRRFVSKGIVSWLVGVAVRRAFSISRILRIGRGSRRRGGLLLKSIDSGCRQKMVPDGSCTIR